MFHLHLIIIVFCDEKTFIQELIICNISDLNTTLKNIKALLKFNPKHHVSNDYDMIPQELIINNMHIHLEFGGTFTFQKK
jgi:hypothetical protein